VGLLLLLEGFDAPLWHAIAVALCVALFYVLPPDRPWGRLGMALSVGAFGGLAAWLVLDWGPPFSILMALVGVGSFLLYTFVESKRSGPG